MFDGRSTQRNLVTAGFDVKVDGVLGALSFAALLVCASARPPWKVPSAPAIGAALATGLETAQINSPLRLRHFLAQAACETFGFTRLVESDGGDPNYFARYEGMKALGNTEPGDGARFKGRGLLDTTGRWNYGELARETGLDCVNHPELLELPADAVEAATLFWQKRGCNAAADANDIRRVTFLVNGGYNGLQDRQTYFGRLGVIAP